MNQFNFNQPGGMPLTTNTLYGMQNAYRIFNQFANLIDRSADKKYIISGCEEVGASITDGFVCIGNELLPLKGATKQNSVFIKEVPTKRLFKDGSEKTVQVERIVTFGTGTAGNNILWGEFQKLPDMRQLNEKIGNNTSSIDSLRTYVNGKVSILQSSINNIYGRIAIIKSDVIKVETLTLDATGIAAGVPPVFYPSVDKGKVLNISCMGTFMSGDSSLHFRYFDFDIVVSREIQPRFAVELDYDNFYQAFEDVLEEIKCTILYKD